MNNIEKILDRVRKLLSLAEHSGSEAEAALAASRAAKLMEEYQLSEALVRLEDASAKPEAILRDARLEPDAPLAGRKRVAWKETISGAVAKDLGVHEFYRYSAHWNGNTMRRCADVRGLGRETAIQTWQYTCQYLWRQVDELADKAWSNEGDDESSMGTVRAWKNAFRSGCAQRLAERIYANRKAARDQERVAREAVANEVINSTPPPMDTIVTNNRHSLALSVIEKDQVEVDEEYAKVKRGFTARAASSIGSTSSADGYGAGRRAGDRVSLGRARAGLPAGQGRLKGGGS